MNRRQFLAGIASVVGLGVLGLAHHKPGHRTPPGHQTTTSTTLAPLEVGYSDVYGDEY